MSDEEIPVLAGPPASEARLRAMARQIDAARSSLDREEEDLESLSMMEWAIYRLEPADRHRFLSMCGDGRGGTAEGPGELAFDVSAADRRAGARIGARDCPISHPFPDSLGGQSSSLMEHEHGRRRDRGSR